MTAIAPEVTAGHERRSFRSAFSWNLFAQLAPMALQLGLTPYLLFRLGADRYGLVALVTAALAMVCALDGGIGSSAQIWFARYRGSSDWGQATRLLVTLAVIVAGGIVLASLAAFVLAPALASVIHAPASLRSDEVLLIRTLTPLVLLTVLVNLGQAFQQACGQWRTTALQQAAATSSYALAAFVFVSLGAGVRGIVLAYVVRQTLLLPAVAWRCWTLAHRDGRRWTPLPDLRAFFGFATAVQMTTIAILFNMQADALIIGFVAPVSVVGYYSIGSNVAEQVRALPLNAMIPVTNDLAGVAGRRGIDEMAQRFRRLQTVWVAWVSGFCAVAAASGFFVVRNWLGPGTGLAAVIAVILIAGHAVNLLTALLSTYTNVLGRPRLEARYSVVGLVVNVVLTVPLALTLGALGVVGATAVGEVLGSVYFLWLCRRRLGAAVGNFLAEVPWTRLVVVGAGVLAMELLLVPAGSGRLANLALSACPPALGLAVFAFLTFGVGPTLGVLRGRALALAPISPRGSSRS